MTRLSNLSSIDFEDLSRDIAKAETGMRFSAFGPGPDGGVDGRHSSADGAIILQSKHYVGSTIRDLKTALKREVPKLDKLKPSRYFLFTSKSLTPDRVDEIAGILGSHLKSVNDVFSQEDIEAALRANPEIEKSHMKLWLSSAAVLERILQSGLEEFTRTTKDEIIDELRVYVRNDSFDEALKLLEKEKILIVSGAPGVGKTTLATMLAYNYLKENWQFYAIKSLDDGFAKIGDRKQTIFFFDDFLGRVELNQQALQNQESALAKFVKRVRKSKNARFILTTRAHIFEEARQMSDYVDDDRMQLAKYILDVGFYSRKIKAQILFNHLSVSDLERSHFAALLDEDWLQKIVDHKNYNPRIIASVSSDILDDVEPKDYPQYILSALDRPDKIWEKPYRALSMRCQNLLIALFFSSEYGITINRLRDNFLELNRIVSGHFGQSTSPDDFDEAVKSLESGFISISDHQVNFVNPSVRDFLKVKLRNEELLCLFPPAARRVDWLVALWRYITTSFEAAPSTKAELAKSFEAAIAIVHSSPFRRTVENDGYRYQPQEDSDLATRISLLLDWWDATQNDTFVEKALVLASDDTIPVDLEREGVEIPELHWRIHTEMLDENSIKPKFLAALQKLQIRVLSGPVATDEIVPIYDAMYEHMPDHISDELHEQFEDLVAFELQETASTISVFDESQLDEHLDILKDIANRTEHDCQSAIEMVTERMAEISGYESEHEAPSPSLNPRHQKKEFSDAELKSMMSNLLKG